MKTMTMSDTVDWIFDETQPEEVAEPSPPTSETLEPQSPQEADTPAETAEEAPAETEPTPEESEG